MKKYLVVYSVKEKERSERFSQVDDALMFVAKKKLDDKATGVELFESVPGKLVMTARIVPIGDSIEPKRRPARKAVKRRVTAADRTRMRTRVLSWVQTNPGKSARDISEGINTTLLRVRESLVALRKGKKVRTKGERVAMRYFPTKPHTLGSAAKS